MARSTRSADVDGLACSDLHNVVCETKKKTTKEPIKLCYVPCLVGTVDLQRECEKYSVRLSHETRKYLVYEVLKMLGASQFQKLINGLVDEGILEWKDDYEVESVLDHFKDHQDSQMYYLIKWAGWGHEYNTWEPEQNLHCRQLLEDYQSLMKRGPRRKRKLPTSSESLQNLKRYRTDELFQKLLESKISETISPLYIIKRIRSYSPVKKKARRNGLLAHSKSRQLQKKRIPRRLLHQEAKKALKDWQDELNNIIKGFDPAPVLVENQVDLEGPPENFIYINERKEGPGVVIPKDPLIGCDCEDCYQNRKKCCVAESGAVLAYYKSNGRLRVPRGFPIYECNIRCKCGPDCLNRVAQKGRKFKICIFRTQNGRGWGVKALQKIKRGSFVMEYVGEVITNEEAERRGKEYDAVGRTYLFDLDFHDADAPFAVDAGVYGNAAHFINHSCDPNLEVHVVWINTLDPQLPHICLFAKRDILTNEELTFDYTSGNQIRENQQPYEVQNSKILVEIGTASDHIHERCLPDTFVADDIEVTLPRRPPNAVSDAKDKGKPAAPITLHEHCGKVGNVSLGHINGAVPSRSGDDLSSACCTAECVTRRNSDTVMAASTKTSFSMACLCGSTNCRKFLFF